MSYFQIFWSFSLESIVETSILSLFWTYLNTCYVLLFVYVSFAYMMTCISFLHMMLCFERVIQCRWKVTKYSSYRNTTMRWQEKLIYHTFCCELVVACYACYYFLFLWPFEWSNWILMYSWKLLRILSLEFRHWSHVIRTTTT